MKFQCKGKGKGEVYLERLLTDSPGDPESLQVRSPAFPVIQFRAENKIFGIKAVYSRINDFHTI